jgi:hypothetical protein
MCAPAGVGSGARVAVGAGVAIGADIAVVVAVVVVVVVVKYAAVVGAVVVVGAGVASAESVAIPSKAELQLLVSAVEHQPLVAASIVVTLPPSHRPSGSYLASIPANANAMYELVTPDVPVLPPVSSV